MNYIFSLFIFVIGAAFSTGLYAQQNEENKCEIKLQDAKYLPSVRKTAHDFIYLKKCKEETPEKVESAYVVFLNTTQGWFDRFGGFGPGIKPMEHLKPLRLGTGNKSATVGVSIKDTLMIHGKEFVPANVQECERVAGTSCGHVLDEFQMFYTHAHQEYTRDEALNTKSHIANLRKEWEPFLNKMRSQTLIEQGINGWWFRRNETVDFSKPPSMQLIVLHPIALLEYMDEAKDGDQLNEAYGLEILGLNWWKKRKWYIPTGGSILALYSDREDVDGWGAGFAMHFDSEYTLGIATHNGENSVFLSIDLWKIFHDKQKVFNSYLGR